MAAHTAPIVLVWRDWQDSQLAAGHRRERRELGGDGEATSDMNHDIAAAGQAGTQEGGVANAAVDTFFHAIERLTRACLMPVIQEAAKLLALEKTRNEKVDGLDVDVDDEPAAPR